MKSDDLIYSDLIISLKTAQEVSDLSSEIDTLLLTIFKSEEMTLDKALTGIRAQSGEKIMQAFSKNNPDANNKEAVRDFLDTLKSLLGKFKVIRLTLAFEPSHKTVNKIHSFIKDSLGTGYILDIDVEESLIGGAIVIFNGKYKDYSLRKSLDEAFADKRTEILMSVQQVKS